MKLGCIGDDFTGSSDLANTLAKKGMRTVQYTGIPNTPAAPDVEAGVIALKSRSIPVQDAVAQSLAALKWLRAQGCTQFFFKYCSTFDSTPQGNIGPVADAMADALGADRVIVCPAFPGTGRSLYQGHLFVGDRLLNESGMETHPLTPMTDPDLRRWLALQTPQAVGHIPAQTVFEGADAIRRALAANAARFLIVDAIRDEDLIEIGAAASDLKLITGGSGVAMGLPANFGCKASTPLWQGQPGTALALSGSCSNATRAQVAHHAAGHPARGLTAADIIEGQVTAEDALDWALEAGDLPLIYTSADPTIVAQVQTLYGRAKAATAIEAFFAELAQRALRAGITRIITAGGETSGAVVEAITREARPQGSDEPPVGHLTIGPEIDPGVPALRATPSLVVALKSGNFGAIDFFEKADKVLGP
ncbi:MAG: 3-oxo-tetronate kinase [Pseudomonadota bacterium]